jgi:zinc transport system permease protein
MPTEQPTVADFLAAWELFRDPVLCAAGAGAVLGFLGVYVVLRRMVFVSAALTQSAALGVALAFYAAIHVGFAVEPIWGAALLSLLATALLLFDPARLHLTRESVLGLLFAGAGGATVLVGDRIAQEAHDIQAILFGTAVLIRPLDLRVVLVAGLVTAAIHLWWFRGLTFASFDPLTARVQGLPVGVLQAVVLVSIGVMVGVTARALGALPVFALTTLPAIAALLVAPSLRAAFLVATVLGTAGGAGGYLVAFLWQFPVGASQTVTLAALAAAAAGARLAVRATRLLLTRARAVG